MSEVSTLCVDGLVGVPCTLSWTELADMGAVRADGICEVALVDVLAGARLGGGADILMMTGGGARPVAFPVAAVMRHDDVHFLVDGSVAGGRVLLDAPDWTGTADPQPVERVTALTFAEFVLRS